MSDQSDSSDQSNQSDQSDNPQRTTENELKNRPPYIRRKPLEYLYPG